MGALIAGGAVKAAAGAAAKGAAGAAAKGAAGTAIKGLGTKVLSGAATGATGKGAIASAIGGLGAAAKGDKKGVLSQGLAAGAPNVADASEPSLLEKFGGLAQGGVDKVQDFRDKAQELVSPGNFFRTAGSELSGPIGKAAGAIGNAFDPLSGQLRVDALFDDAIAKQIGNRRKAVDLIGEDDEALAQILAALEQRGG